MCTQGVAQTLLLDTMPAGVPWVVTPKLVKFGKNQLKSKIVFTLVIWTVEPKKAQIFVQTLVEPWLQSVVKYNYLNSFKFLKTLASLFV